MANWSIAQLLNYFTTFSNHRPAIRQAIAGMDLTRRQQAALCQIELGSLDEDWAEIFARQGAASIERVVDLRREAYQRVPRLREVLRVTRLSALDQQLLLETLARGRAADRESALEIIQEFALDSPAIRRAVAESKDDCDDKVRELAIGLSSNF